MKSEQPAAGRKSPEKQAGRRRSLGNGRRKSGCRWGHWSISAKRATGRSGSRSLDYSPNQCEEKEIKGLQECFYFADTSLISWIDVEGLHEVEQIQQLGECQGF